LLDAFAGDDDFFGNGAHGHLYIDASFLRDFQDHAVSAVFLEAGSGNAKVVSAAGESGNDVSAFVIGRRGAGEAASGTGDHDIGGNDGSSGFVADGASDVAGVLGRRGESDTQR